MRTMVAAHLSTQSVGEGSEHVGVGSKRKKGAMPATPTTGRVTRRSLAASASDLSSIPVAGPSTIPRSSEQVDEGLEGPTAKRTVSFLTR